MSLWFLLTYIHSDLWASGRNLSIKSIIIIIIIVTNYRSLIN